MYPELFRIPFTSIPIRGYGLMLVIGLLLAIELAKFLARRLRVDPEIFSTAAILALVSGLAGARLSHVFENWSTYTDPTRSVAQNFMAAINITSGGLTYYGGFLLATPVLIIYALWKKVPLAVGMDIVAPCLMVGLAFGRVGCLLNGCCYGATCDLPWAIRFPYYSTPYVEHFAEGRLQPPIALFRGEPDGSMRLVPPETAAGDPVLRPIAAVERSLPVHPTQVYSTITALLLAGVCVAFLTFRKTPGRVFALMMILEGVGRFLLESVRVEPPVAHFMGYGLSYSMVVGLGVSAGGLVLWGVFGVVAAYGRRGAAVGTVAAGS